MATLSQNSAIIRRRLNQPNPDAPSEPQIIEVLIDTLMNMHAALVNTQNHWAVNHWTLNVSSGTEDYVVAAADFGRPFLVHSVDASDSYHVRREVPLTLLQDADQLYRGPQQTYSTYEWSAAEMVFYRRAGSWYARPVPIPGASASYKVWYETDTYSYAAPSDEPGLKAFHHLVRCEAALSLLPYCRWGAVSPVDRETAPLWANQAKALEMALGKDLAAYRQQFDSYRAQSQRGGVTSRQFYGDDGWGDAGGRMTDGWGW